MSRLIFRNILNENQHEKIEFAAMLPLLICVEACGECGTGVVRDGLGWFGKGRSVAERSDGRGARGRGGWGRTAREKLRRYHKIEFISLKLRGQFSHSPSVARGFGGIEPHIIIRGIVVVAIMCVGRMP